MPIRGLAARAALAFFAVFFSLGPPSAEAAEQASTAAQTTHPAAQAIEVMGSDAFAVLSDRGLSRDQKAQRFRQMLVRDLDTTFLARYVLGSYWDKVDTGVRDAFVDAFRDYVVARYATLLGGAEAVERFQVLGARTVPQGGVYVTSRIERAGQATIETGWYVREQGDRYLIVDVVADGTSLAKIQKDEISAVLRRSKGDIPALTALLRKKTG